MITGFFLAEIKSVSLPFYYKALLDLVIDIVRLYARNKMVLFMIAGD